MNYLKMLLLLQQGSNKK